MNHAAVIKPTLLECNVAFNVSVGIFKPLFKCQVIQPETQRLPFELLTSPHASFLSTVSHVSVFF